MKNCRCTTKRKKDDEDELPPLKETVTKKKTVLINMLNPDQALKVVASFSEFAGQLWGSTFG